VEREYLGHENFQDNKAPRTEGSTSIHINPPILRERAASTGGENRVSGSNGGLQGGDAGCLGPLLA
jgi:hypothetical protein